MKFEDYLENSRKYADSADWCDSLNHLVMAAFELSKIEGYPKADRKNDLSRAIGYIGGKISDATEK